MPIDYVVAVVFEHYLYDILADIMNVALYGSHDDLPLCISGLVSHGFLDDCEGCLCSISAHEELGKEYCSFLKAFADAVK